MDKKNRYASLVEKRKSFLFHNDLKNPSQTNFDTQEIEPWANLKNDLDAEIMIIGQEFCDYKTYIKTEGKV